MALAHLQVSGQRYYLCTTFSHRTPFLHTPHHVKSQQPFISWISRAWQVRENNGPRKFEYSSVSVW